MRRLWFAGFAGLCWLAMSWLASAFAATSDPTATLVQTVGVLTAERAGFVGFRRRVASTEWGPGRNISIETDSGWLRSNGNVVAIRFYDRTKDGALASPSQLAKLQAEADKNLPGDDYTLPLVRAAIADYQFATTACAACPAGQTAIAFTSRKRDGDHGDGTMILEAATHRVVRLEFVPSVLPPHVDRATIVMKFGRVLPDLWDLITVKQHYSGHMLLFRGGEDIVTGFSDYHRFRTKEEGTHALAAGL